MPPDQALGRRSRGARVLVVEDEFLIAMHLERLLQEHDWRVLGPAATVAQAFSLLDGGEKPAVAVLDVNLGGELVTPVTEALRVRGVPFVLASAHNRLDLMVPALAGVLNLGKPTDQGRLLAALTRAVAA